jgi:hypothetical protein
MLLYRLVMSLMGVAAAGALMYMAARAMKEAAGILQAANPY